MGGSGIADHLGLAMTIRAAIIMIFPIAAQFALDRADI
jgi:hypothetical protein